MKVERYVGTQRERERERERAVIQPHCLYNKICMSWTFFLTFYVLFPFLLSMLGHNEKHMSRLVTKPTKLLCTQRRHRSAWASAQSYQSFRCALNGYLKTQAFFVRTAKTLIRLGRCVWVFAGRTTTLFVCHEAAHMFCNVSRIYSFLRQYCLEESHLADTGLTIALSSSLFTDDTWLVWNSPNHTDK